MDIIFLLKSGLGLIATLGILVFLLILPANKRQKQNKAKPQKEHEEVKKEKLPIDLKELIKIVKNKDIDSTKLKETLDTILKYHGKIPHKLGARTNPAFSIYEDIIFTICRHPNTTADIILTFNTGLEKLNEEYKPQINDALSRGLNSRVIR